MEELTLRENRRVKTALLVARLTTIKTLAGFDFTFQPSLDRERIMALAELTFNRPGRGGPSPRPARTGKSHLATALAVEAVKAGRSVVFLDVGRVDRLAGQSRARRRVARADPLPQPGLAPGRDEIGYLPVVPGGGNLFFQLVNARYEKGAMILTSNRGFAEWGEVFGDPVVATVRRAR